MKGLEALKRYMILFVGLFFMGMGVAMTKCAELGVPTISSVPNVLSLKFTFMSVGTWLALWNCTMLVGQLLILRKDFRLIQLLQIPVSLIFGYFTDLGMVLFSFIQTDHYLIQLFFSAAGVVVLGFGISFTILADKVMNPGEAVVKVVADKLGKDFGNIKIIFDCLCVALAVVLSMVFFNFSIEGVREGTIIAVFGTGNCVKLFTGILKKPVEVFFKSERRK